MTMSQTILLVPIPVVCCCVSPPPVGCDGLITQTGKPSDVNHFKGTLGITHLCKRAPVYSLPEVAILNV